MNKKINPVDLGNVRTIPISQRKNKVSLVRMATTYDPGKEKFSAFVKSLPGFLAADALRDLAGEIRRSAGRDKPVILMLGAHVVKVGLSPLIIDLVKRGIVSAVAMNGAAAIHDTELAMWGITSEDVEENLLDGTFGMSRETGEFINGTLKKGILKEEEGFGAALGSALKQAPNRGSSILAACWKSGIPVTVHVGMGTDIIHQQPTMDGGVTGEMSFRDFKLFCAVVRGLKDGGVVLNIGSAVILPEVFLKALTVARNLGGAGRRVRGFTTANFDMIQHYRPRVNVVQRPTKNSGKGYMFTGHHEIMVPLLCALVKDKTGRR